MNRLSVKNIYFLIFILFFSFSVCALNSDSTLEQKSELFREFFFKACSNKKTERCGAHQWHEEFLEQFGKEITKSKQSWVWHLFGDRYYGLPQRTSFSPEKDGFAHEEVWLREQKHAVSAYDNKAWVHLNLYLRYRGVEDHSKMAARLAPWGLLTLCRRYAYQNEDCVETLDGITKECTHDPRFKCYSWRKGTDLAVNCSAIIDEHDYSRIRQQS